MKKTKLLKSLLIFTIALSSIVLTRGQNAWINEIHYDNTGTDANEFIEVIIENAGSYTLANFSVVLYNGNGGASYDTKTLDLFTVGTISGSFSFFYYTYPSNGIQNGSPDGMALAYQGNLIAGQFLSYEGTFTAVGGPANGILSVDIGVAEAGTEPLGNSLQLSGTGTQYNMFAWQPPATATPGALNNGQTLGGTVLPEPTNYPTSFTAAGSGIVIDLSWTDATGAQLPGAYLLKASDQDNITAPADGTPELDDTDMSDGQGALNVPYGDEACTFYRLAGQTEYFFKIYPYTNTGSNINYKTDGTPPSAQATTDIVINTEDFESNSFGTWTTYTVASDKDWGVVNFGGALGTTYFAQMNGFNENEPSNDWLISPSLNMNNYTNEKMVFYTQWKFGTTDAELTLKYSTNYTGGDPTLASWTDLTFTKPATQEIWGFSGDVDLTGITGTSVHISFQYLSSGSPRRWGVDEIAITGDASGPVITVITPSGGEEWEQGTAHLIEWNVINTQANVKIELTTDASNPTPTWTVLNPSLPANQGSWLWNIAPDQTTSDDCQIRITDFTSDAFGLSGIFSIIEPIYVPDIVITELMYNPPESGADSLEFIELYNNDNVAADLEGYYFSAGVNFTFPVFTLQPGQYILVAVDSVAMQSVFGMWAYQYSGALGNSGELVQLMNNYNMTVDSVHYLDVAPWPTSPDGSGPSLAFCDPNLDNSIGENWSAAGEFAAINSNGDTIYASPMASCTGTPNPDFMGTPTVLAVGGSVTFTDLSTGNPTTWIWTFVGGNPGSFNGQNPPPVVYNTAGTFNVALQVINAYGDSLLVKENYITAGYPPSADFTSDQTTIFEGEFVNFTDLSTNTPISWSWEFSGGTPGISTVQNPSGIQYLAAGNYDVTLTVTNTFGSDTKVKEDYIEVQPVGIPETQGNVIAIYPNPSAGQVNIVNKTTIDLNVDIYDLLGAKVTEFKAIPGGNSFSFDDLHGVFFVSISDAQGKILYKSRLVIM